MMMPLATKVICILILGVAMGGGLGYTVYHMTKHPEEWFFWRKDFFLKQMEFDEDDEEDEND